MRARHYVDLVDGLVVAKHAVGPDRQADGTERARHYVDLVDGLVVAKHAVGPDRQADGTEAYPAVPSSWVLVPFETYRDVRVGCERVGDTYQPPAARRRPERIEERLMRMEAVMRLGEKRLAALTARVAVLERRR